jgi:hypothetical protein
MVTALPLLPLDATRRSTSVTGCCSSIFQSC